jgi:rhodanese-related sulfurtransferase
MTMIRPMPMIPIDEGEPMNPSTRNARRIVAVGALAVTVAACGSSDETTSAVGSAPIAAAAYGLVDAARAAELAASGITVLDVRTPEEFAEGHIDGAELIDFYEPTFAERIAQLDRSREYLVYCRSGNRSGQTVELMEELGFGRLWELDGGVLAIGDELDLVP